MASTTWNLSALGKHSFDEDTALELRRVKRLSE